MSKTNALAKFYCDQTAVKAGSKAIHKKIGDENGLMLIFVFSMPYTEQQYISLCKKQIEKKFSFGNGHGYSQRDLETLSQHIEEKTGVCISLSTLKRLWKNSFKQSPQLATLNALAAVLEYKDWQDFKLQSQKQTRRPKPLVTGIFIGLAIVTVTAFVIGGLGDGNMKEAKRSTVKVKGSVQFTAEKTVTSGIPNTVFFKYDISNVEADSFFIQQTWNDNHRVRIDPKGNTTSDIYYESGYHRARLLANDSIIAMQPIHILSDGWEPHVYYSDKDLVPIDFRHENFIGNGQLHLSRELLQKQQVDLSKSFYSRVSNSQVFNVPSDNFSISTRMKSDSAFSSLCPWMNLMLVTEKHMFYISLQKKGCERYAGYKLGEIIKNGEGSDLSALGCNTYDWQEVEIKVRNKKATILINGNEAFTEVFKEDFGNIVGLTYIFEGTGSIDYVKLTKADDEVVFQDEFDGVAQ